MVKHHFVDRNEGVVGGEVLVLCRSMPSVGDGVWEMLSGYMDDGRVTLVCGVREGVNLEQWREVVGFVDHFVLHCPSLVRRIVSRIVGKFWGDGGDYLMDRQVTRNSDLSGVCGLYYDEVVVMDRRMMVWFRVLGVVR